MKTKQQILERMELYRVEGGGIGSWLTESTREGVFQRLGVIDTEPLSAVQLNQLLVLAHEAPVSDGFFRYYWIDVPDSHTYDVRKLPNFKIFWQRATSIISLDHLAWGLHRLYIDGLLYFGNVRTAFRALRECSRSELVEYFSARRFDTDAIKRRGPPLPVRSIDREKRYLISEMACKSYGDDAQVESILSSALNSAWNTGAQGGAASTTIGALLQSHLASQPRDVRDSLMFSASEILNRHVTSQEDIATHYKQVAFQFEETRAKALLNTENYLSMLSDLDVYVATSMRTPDHFLKMADVCDSVFGDPKLSAMNLRYFDPTVSAATGHEDKGLIECLMVKCAKALLYCAGDKESWGKDAEAAMALSLGHPVIFYCEERGAQFYRDVHPLTRLIHFETGVAVGAMVAESLDHVVELLSRTFENRMVYRLEKTRTNAIRLIEDLTGSVVRVQTGDKLLTEAFWNHYHQDRRRRAAHVVAAPNLASTTEPRQELEAQPLPVQTALDLPDTTKLERLAARSSSPASGQASASAQGIPNTAPRSDAAFPLSLKEVFEAISKTKCGQVTGAKRYAVFSSWMAAEQLGVLEGVKLLRFIESTLTTNNARPNYAYTPADLTRWYREMSAGDIAGSLR